MWKRRGELIQLYILMFQTHTRPHKGKSVTWMHFDPRYMNKQYWSLIIICKRHLWNRATSAALLSAVQVLFSFHCHLGPSCTNVSSGKQQQAAKEKKSIAPPPHTHSFNIPSHRIWHGSIAVEFLSCAGQFISLKSCEIRPCIFQSYILIIFCDDACMVWSKEAKQREKIKGCKGSRSFNESGILFLNGLIY